MFAQRRVKHLFVALQPPSVYGWPDRQVARAAALWCPPARRGLSNRARPKTTSRFDECMDTAPMMTCEIAAAPALKDACPRKHRHLLENVAAKCSRRYPMMNPHGRYPICGMIACYNAVVRRDGREDVRDRARIVGARSRELPQGCECFHHF